MLYSHSYNDGKVMPQPGSMISIKNIEQAETQIHITRSLEPLLCAATVDFYPANLLRETVVGSRSWFCLGGHRKISVGLKSLTEDGRATVVVLQDSPRTKNEDLLAQRELNLSLDLDKRNGKIQGAVIIDGPLLVTCTSKGTVQAHSLHAPRDGKLKQVTVRLGNEDEESAERAREIVNFEAARAGMIEGRRRVVSLFITRGAPWGQREQDDGGNSTYHTCRISFCAANLCAFLLGLAVTAAGHTAGPKQLYLDRDLSDASRLLPGGVNLAFTSSESKWDRGTEQQQPLFVILVQELGGLCVTCTERGTICAQYGEEVVSQKDLPLPAGISVQRVSAMDSPEHNEMAPQALLVVTCSCSPAPEINSTSNGSSGGLGKPFTLVFTLPGLAMVTELRGCHSVQPVASSTRQGPLWLCFVATPVTTNTSAATSTSTGGSADFRVGPQPHLLPVLVTAPSLTQGLTVYRRNGTSRSLLPGTAANLANIYASSGSSVNTEGGKTRKVKSKKKRAGAAVTTESASTTVSDTSTAMVSPTVSYALQSRLSTLQEEVHSLREACGAKARQLDCVYRALSAWTTPGEPALELAAEAMTRLSESHSDLFGGPHLSTGQGAATKACPKVSISSARGLGDPEISTVGQRNIEAGKLDTSAPHVLAAVALPHPASGSLTLLLRVRHPCTYEDTAGRPFFGVKVQSSLLSAAPTSRGIDLDSQSAVVPVLLPGQEVWLTCKVPVSQAMFMSTSGNGNIGEAAELAVHATVTYLPCLARLTTEAVLRDREAACLAVAQHQSGSSDARASEAGSVPGCVAVLSADDYFGVACSNDTSSDGYNTKESLYAHRQAVEARWGRACRLSSNSPRIAAVLTPAAGPLSAFPWWHRNGEKHESDRLVDSSWLAALLAEWVLDAAIGSGGRSGGSRSITHYSYAASRPALLISRTKSSSSSSSSKSNVDEDLGEATQRLRSSNFLSVVRCDSGHVLAPTACTLGSEGGTSSDVRGASRNERMKALLQQVEDFLPQLTELAPFMHQESTQKASPLTAPVLVRPAVLQGAGEGPCAHRGGREGATILATCRIFAPVCGPVPQMAIYPALSACTSLVLAHVQKQVSARADNVLVLPLVDSEENLEASRLAAQQLLIAFKELAHAWRIQIAASRKLRLSGPHGGDPGGADPALETWQEEAHAQVRETEGRRAPALGSQLGLVPHEQVVRCLHSRRLADVAMAQALAAISPSS